MAAAPVFNRTLSLARQEQASEELKAFLGKFGTLRIVDSGESTPDALFGKLNAVVVEMVREVRDQTSAQCLLVVYVVRHVISLKRYARRCMPYMRCLWISACPVWRPRQHGLRI